MSKIPLLTFCHSAHDVLFDEFFEPSVKAHLENDFRLVRMGGDQKEQAIFATQQFNDLVKGKIQGLYDFMIGSTDEFFVYSDSDIVFFGDIKEPIIEALKDKSMTFQLNGDQTLSTGFFAARINDEVKHFFKSMLDSYDTEFNDEGMLNIRIGGSGIEYSLLGNEFFTLGTIHGAKYGPSQIKYGNIETPIFPILMFHANYIVGVENKAKLLNHYKKWNNDGTKDYYNGNLFLLGLLPCPLITLNKALWKHGYKDAHNNGYPLRYATVNRYLSGETVVANVINIFRAYPDAKYFVLKQDKDKWVESMFEEVIDSISFIRKSLNKVMYGKVWPSKEDLSRHFDIWNHLIEAAVVDYGLDHIPVTESNIDEAAIDSFLRISDD